MLYVDDGVFHLKGLVCREESSSTPCRLAARALTGWEVLLLGPADDHPLDAPVVFLLARSIAGGILHCVQKAQISIRKPRVTWASTKTRTDSNSVREGGIDLNVVNRASTTASRTAYAAS